MIWADFIVFCETVKRNVAHKEKKKLEKNLGNEQSKWKKTAKKYTRYNIADSDHKDYSENEWSPKKILKKE